MRVLIIGANGQVGSELQCVLAGNEVFPFGHEELDVTDFSKVNATTLDIRPDWILNCSAWHRVDYCEQIPEQSFLVNSLAVRNMALLVNRIQAGLVHISTDYVFDGRQRQPYEETDCPSPLSTYAVSKLSGEIFVQTIAEKYYLIRTCGVFGKRGRGNFISAVLDQAQAGKPVKVVDDQIVSPTRARELAEHIVKLLSREEFGLFHMTSRGECSWYQFAKAIFEKTATAVDLQPVSAAEYSAPARRPDYSVLENRRLQKLNLDRFSHWERALDDHLKEIGLLRL